METKKICYISLTGYNYFNQDSNYTAFGGAELQTYLLAKEVAKNKLYKVSVLVSDDDNKKNYEYYNNIRILKIKKTKNYFSQLINFYNTLKKERPNFIYKRGIGKTLFICIIYRLLNPKTKVIYHIASTLDINGQRFKGFWGKLLYFSFKLSDILIVQTNDQLNILNKKDRKKVPKSGILRNIYNYNKEEFNKKGEFILWVSRCVDIKRPELFLDLADSFPGEKFVMICPKFDLKLWNKIKNKSLNYKNLNFIESIAYDKINEFYKKAKVFINTSTHEGYPNTFLQAADSKTPILSLNINPDNLLTKYKIGIECQNDFSKLKFELNKLLTDKNYYNIFSSNGIKYLKEIHDIKLNVNKFKNIINNTNK
jgi:hypothetical protein